MFCSFQVYCGSNHTLTYFLEIKINKFENSSHFKAASISKSETKVKVVFLRIIPSEISFISNNMFCSFQVYCGSNHTLRKRNRFENRSYFWAASICELETKVKVLFLKIILSEFFSFQTTSKTLSMYVVEAWMIHLLSLKSLKVCNMTDSKCSKHTKRVLHQLDVIWLLKHEIAYMMLFVLPNMMLCVLPNMKL